MADFSVGSLVGTISLNDQFSGPIGKVAEAVGLTGESFGAVTQLAGLAVGAIAGATGAIVALGLRGAVVADVQGAFENLTGAAGSSADVMLGQLQTATLGTVTNFDLMREANKLLSAGLLTGQGDMKTLAEGAKLLGDQTGIDTAAAFDTLTGAILSGRPTQLAQMGLFIDSKRAVEEYEKEHGKLPGTLSAAETKMAISNATLAELKKKLEEGGPAVRDFGDIVDAGKVAVQNFTDNLGIAIARSPVVAAGMGVMQTALQDAFGGSQQETVKTLMGYVNDFAIALVDGGLVAVRAAEAAVVGFTFIKVGFNLVLEVLATGISKAADLIADLAAKGAALPVVGGQFAELEGKVRAIADTADAVALGFGELKDAGMDSADKQRAAFDTAAGVLGTMRDKMIAAKDATADLTTKTQDIKKPLDDAGGAAGLTAKQIASMQEAAEKSATVLLISADTMRTTFAQLQTDLTLANLTGVEARQFEIEQARLKEIAGLQHYAFEVGPEAYNSLVSLVNEKYGLMTQAAAGHFASVELAAANAGFKTKEELQLVADNASTLYADMLASGKFSFGELQAAHKKATDAMTAVNGIYTLGAIAKFEQIASAASGILRTGFLKSKTASIAAVIIDTAAAVVKTFAQFGFPFGLIPAAAMVAIGADNIAKIRSADVGFAQGTPDMSFVDFGRVSTVDLHGPEAVVNRKQGKSLTDMVEESLNVGENRTVAQLQRMEAAQEARDRRLPIMLRDAALLANA